MVQNSGEMLEQCTVNVTYMIQCYMPAITDLLTQHMDMGKCNHHGSVTQIQCCSHLKEEALDRTMWGAGFGGGFGTVVRQTTK
jgi:hypothetical protein